MIIGYLKETVTGAASKKCYGKKGDKIYVIRNSHDMFVVCNEKGDKFYIRQDNFNGIGNINNTKKILK